MHAEVQFIQTALFQTLLLGGVFHKYLGSCVESYVFNFFKYNGAMQKYLVERKL